MKRTPLDILTNPESVQVMYRPVVVSGVRKMPNIFSKTYEEDRKWWTEQVNRCMYGYIAPDGKYINPVYYFYLNFVQVPLINELENNKKGIYPPYYRDGDEVYFDDYYYSLVENENGVTKNAENIIVSKARRKAWTTSELFGITMWHFIFKKSLNISRAYPNEIIQEKERKLFEECYNRIHPFFKKDKNGKAISLVVSNKTTLSQGVIHPGGRKEVINSINLFTVSAKGGGVRGDAIGLIVVVEAGMHTNLKTFFGAAKETVSLSNYQFGNIIIGGTSDAINNESEDYKNMYYGHKIYNARKIFTPADVCFFGAFDYFTGKSNRILAKNLIDKRRKELRDAGDHKALAMFIQENPLFDVEAFIPSTNSEYDSDLIDEQLSLILASEFDNDWIRGKLRYKTQTEEEKKMDIKPVEFHEDPEGLWLVHSKFGFPDHKLDNAYLQSIDDVYKDKAPESDSLNCTMIYLKPNIYTEISDLPVAFYLGRHGSRILDYAEFTKGALFWDTSIMYEHNESNGFIGYARKHSIIDRFIWHNGQIGIRLSGAAVADLTMLGLEYFDEGRHKNILHSDIIKSFKYWGSEKNSDISSAFHLILFGLQKDKIGTKFNEESSHRMVEETPVFAFGSDVSSDAGYFMFG